MIHILQTEYENDPVEFFVLYWFFFFHGSFHHYFFFDLQLSLDSEGAEPRRRPISDHAGIKVAEVAKR